MQYSRFNVAQKLTAVREREREREREARAIDCYTDTETDRSGELMTRYAPIV